MKNMKIKAWGCVGIMMLGVLIGLSSIAFLGNDVMIVLIWILAIICFLTGMILHFVLIRCPHCGSYLGRLYGPKCPFCGRDYNKTE